MQRYFAPLLLPVVLANPALSGLVLVFNPQPRPMAAQVELPSPGTADVEVRSEGKRLPCQTEDANGDGQSTDQDIIYARLLVQPGNNWLEVKKGTPEPTAAESSVVREGDVLRTDWLDLDSKSGRPLACRMADGSREEISFDMQTAAGKWSELTGRLRISDLPLRTRLDFVSAGEKPVQIAVMVYRSGRCDIETTYPHGVPPGKWQQDRNLAGRDFLTQTASVVFPRPPGVRFHWLSTAGHWYETAAGHTRYRVQPFFAGLYYPQHESGLGLFMLDLDPNVAAPPWNIKCHNAGDPNVWRVDGIIHMTDPRWRLAFVRYGTAADPKNASPAINDLYFAPQVYAGEALRQMVEQRTTALEEGPAGGANAVAAAVRATRTALENKDPREALARLEAARSQLLRDTRTAVARLRDQRPVGAAAALTGHAETLLVAQAQDRTRPRRFVRKPWGVRAYRVDRLVRADERLAAAFRAAARAAELMDGEHRNITEAQVSGPAEVFRVGFGTCGGLHTDLFDLKWGYDFFAPLIELGIRNFHFQSIRWETYGLRDGTLHALEGWERLFEAFDRVGATATPQLQPFSWCAKPGWIKRRYADCLRVYEIERAGIDGQPVKERKERFIWRSPEIWGSVPGFQQGFADFCHAVVRRLKHHRCIIGWPMMNEPSASAELELSHGEFSVEGFRRYLRLRYRTIEALNQAWGSRYATFDEAPIEAPEERERSGASLDLSGTWRFAVDPRNEGREKGWAQPRLDDSQWKSIKVPGYWEGQLAEHKDYDGLAWYRRKAAIPADWAGMVVRLRCAGIDDDAEVFVNGTMVEKKSGHATPVDVEVSGAIRPGTENLIAILVNDTFVNGGVYKPVTVSAEPVGTRPSRFRQPQRQLDREMYSQETQAGICTHHSRVVREADPARPSFTKEWNLKTPAEGPHAQLDSFLAAPSHLGVVGCDMYKSMGWYPMAIDMLRSTGEGKPIWLTETHYYSPHQDAPEGLRMGTWAMAVRGLRSAYFWGAKIGYEGDCRVNDFALEMAKMQHELDALAPVLGARRRVETALYLPRDSQYLCDRSAIDQTWQQLWRLLNALNVPVDFVDDKWIDRGKLTGYRCLLIPVSPFMRKATAARIAGWVRGGGSVVLWSGSAVYDYAGNTLSDAPGWGLVDLFGARVVPKPPESAQLELRGSLSAGTIECDSGVLKHRLELREAVPQLDDGKGRVAISLKRAGKGKALLTALHLGELFPRADEAQRLAIARTVWGLLGLCGVEPAVSCLHRNCEAHLLEREDRAWLVLINFSAQDQTMAVTTRPRIPGRSGPVYDALSLEQFGLEATADGQRGTYPIPAYGVRVVKVAGR